MACGPRDDSNCATADQNDCEVEAKIKVRSLSEFIGVPLPDVYGHYPPLHPEPLNPKKAGIQRFVTLER